MFENIQAEFVDELVNIMQKSCLDNNLIKLNAIMSIYTSFCLGCKLNEQLTAGSAKATLEISIVSIIRHILWPKRRENVLVFKQRKSVFNAHVIYCVDVSGFLVALHRSK